MTNPAIHQPDAADDIELEAAFDLDYGDWGDDPAAILERIEIEFGINCFDQPIN